ncbi:MAG: S1 RNA-binding domain-containing protein, partial [Gemmataceae bacterium]
PETLVQVGDEIEVKVLRVDVPDRKIGLSRKRLNWTPEQDAANPPAPAALSSGGSSSSAPSGGPGAAKQQPRTDLRGGTGSGGDLVSLPEG